MKPDEDLGHDRGDVFQTEDEENLAERDCEERNLPDCILKTPPLGLSASGNMAEQAGSTCPVSPFEYELFEGDPDHLRTVVATPAMAGPWIDPASLKLKHRIGRGPFGDVWLATHHQSGDDFDEYHEVAVKMLHPLKEEDTQKLIDKFETIFYKFRGFESMCWLYGISILDGKVTLVNRWEVSGFCDLKFVF